MSTVHGWFDDTEIEWDPRRVASPRAPHRLERCALQRGRRVGAALAAVALVVAAAVVGPERGGGAPPAPPELAAAPATPQSAATSTAAAPAMLAAIAHCESRGDPAAVSADGRYRGKYQFDLATWRSVGGAGDPARAPEREQDRRARALAAERGTQPWPACGSAAPAG